MIPKKIRRTLTIDKASYEYCVTGRFAKSIFVKNLGTKKSFSVYIDDEVGIHPWDIKKLIGEKKI
jgi:hypothetical protein